MSLVLIGVLNATQLSAATKPYVQEKIIYNTSGIPNEAEWEAYEKKRKANEARAKQSPKTGNDFNICSCVSYARFATGINVGPIGLAKYHPVNSTVPVVGGLVVTYESWTGHMAVVTKIEEDGFWVKEFNYKKCAYSERKILNNFKLLKGFYNP